MCIKTDPVRNKSNQTNFEKHIYCFCYTILIRPNSWSKCHNENIIMIALGKSSRFLGHTALPLRQSSSKRGLENSLVVQQVVAQRIRLGLFQLFRQLFTLGHGLIWRLFWVLGQSFDLKRFQIKQKWLGIYMHYNAHALYIQLQPSYFQIKDLHGVYVSSFVFCFGLYLYTVL